MKENLHTRKIILNILTLIILFCIFVWIYILQKDHFTDNSFDQLTRTCQMVSTRVKVTSSINTTYSNLYVDDNKFYSKLASILVKDKFTQEYLDYLNDIFCVDGNYVYYIDDTGRLYYTDHDDIPVLDVSDENYDKLADGENIKTDEYLYMSTALAGGHLIMRWNNLELEGDSVTIDGSRIQSRSCIIILDANSGNQIYSSDGLTINADQIRYIDDTDHVPADTNLRMSYFINTDSSNPFVRLANSYYGCFTEDDNYKIIAYTPIKQIWVNALVYASISYIFLLICAYVVYLCGRKITADDLSAPKTVKKLFGSRYFHMGVFKKISVIMVSVILILTLEMAFILIAINFAHSYQDSYDSLKNVEASVTSMKNSSEDITNKWLENQFYRLETVNTIFNDFPDMLSSDNLNTMRMALGACELTLYDENGIAVCSNSNINQADGGFFTNSEDSITGYKITENPDDGEYRLWDLYQGSLTEDAFQIDDGYNDYIIAMRRKGAKGIIKMRISSDTINKITRVFNLKDATLTSDYVGIMFYSTGDTSSINFADRENNTVRTVSNPFNEHVFENEALGSAVFNKVLYSVVTRMTDTYVLINAIPFTTTVGNHLPAINWSVVGALLLYIALVFDCCIITIDDPKLIPEADAAAKDTFDPSQIGLRFKAYIRSTSEVQLILGKTLILFLFYPILMFLADYLTSGISIITLLFIGNWEKSVNIISVSYLIFTAICFFVIKLILDKLNAMLSHYVDNHASTILGLIHSLILFVLAIVVILSDLSSFGVDTATLVAGIGVTGLALGMGAQNTIKDFIAGVCMVLDGNIRVGDFIEVNGFYGRITYMDVRNTRINSDSAVLTLSNSSMTNVKNFSKIDSMFKMKAVFTSYEDSQKFKQLLKDEESRINEETMNMIRGHLFISGVDKTGGGTFEAALIGFFEEENRYRIVALVKDSLYKLTDEAGINMVSLS